MTPSSSVTWISAISCWNRGAQELYGWAPQEATGKRSDQLLRTNFPAPIDDIHAELLRVGRWEGELKRTKSDGTAVVVASRWALRRDEQERPVAILETNNDITERKTPGGEEIRGLQRGTGESDPRNSKPPTRSWKLSPVPFRNDLRAPLRHMAGGTPSLLQKKVASLLDDKSHRYMTMILESAKRMGNLIDDLLTFSAG